MAEQPAVDGQWTPWEVADSSGFEVSGSVGRVGLIQVSASEFEVANSFRFTNQSVEDDLREKLTDADISEEDANDRIEKATNYVLAAHNRTDLASVPIFMRWFENTYGRHTLAAIIHDELIVADVNGGALGSDTLADRFFRKMLQAADVPTLKAWVMWSAVALRSRWAAGGWRRISLIVWGLVAVIGIASFGIGVFRLLSDQELSAGTASLLIVPAFLPALAAPLWGKQWGASFIAALAGVFVIPAALFVIVGTAVYWVMERAAAALGY